MGARQDEWRAGEPCGGLSEGDRTIGRATGQEKKFPGRKHLRRRLSERGPAARRPPMKTSKNRARPVEAAFYDPKTGDKLEEGVDALGQNVIGEDEHGLWWGTPRAAWVLPCTGTMRLVFVSGVRGAEAYDGAFLGSADAAISYVERRGVKVTHVELGTGHHDALTDAEYTREIDH